MAAQALSLEILLKRGDELLRQRRDFKKLLELYEEANRAAADSLAALQGMAMTLR